MLPRVPAFVALPQTAPPPATIVDNTTIIPDPIGGWQLVYDTGQLAFIPDGATAELEAYDCQVESAFGFTISGNVPDPIALQAQIRAQGSELYLLRIWEQPGTFLGTGTDTYRVLAVHSQSTAFFDFVLNFIRTAAIIGAGIYIVNHIATAEQALNNVANDLGLIIGAPFQQATQTLIYFMLFTAGLGVLLYLGYKELGANPQAPAIPAVQSPNLSIGTGSTYGFRLPGGTLTSSSSAGTGYGGAPAQRRVRAR